MKKLLLLMSLLSIFNLASARDFAEGQVWSYKARPGEEGSTVLINKIESYPKLGKVIHISIFGVKVRNKRAPSGVTSDLPHFPVSETTLNASLVKLLRKSSPNPEYVEGYQTWKTAFDQGDAGVFTISVAEIVGVIEDAINK